MRLSAPGRGRRAPLSLQVLALVIVSLVVAQVAAFTAVLVLPPDHAFYRVEEIASALRGGSLATRFGRPLVRRLEPSPPSRTGLGWSAPYGYRRELARALGVDQDKLRLQIFAPPPFVGLRGGRGRYERPPGERPPPGDFPPAARDGAVGDRPPPSREEGVGAAPAGGEPFVGQREPQGWRWRGPPLHASFVAALHQPDGRWLTVTPAPEPFPNAWQRRIILWFLASLAVIGPMTWLFARRLAAPLRRFADAADRLGRDPRTPPLALKGPAEIGLAAAAFNRMQARLQRYVEDRTAMVGAISHDLRTPLARIRFKVESASPELKRAVLQDVAQMEEMIGSVLAFIRDASEPGARERLDLRSLVECEVDEAALVGGDVALAEGDSLIVEADASAVQRVVANLIDNALKYGERAKVSLHRDEAEAVVEVADSGPGLPASELERVFLPFYRAEAARSLDKGGIGLGLAVSRSIARAHGGDVRLANTGSGLVAQVRIPLAAEAASA